MRVFSIQALWSGVYATTRRFPTEVLIAVLATTIAVVLMHGNDLALTTEATRLLTLSAIAGIFLFAVQLSITIANEAGGMARPWMWALRAVATVLAAVVVAVVDLDSYATPIELVTLFVATHACIALAPWRRGAMATWDMGRTLLLRVGLAGIFTSVLSGGIVLAVTALDVLFDVTVNAEVYGDINFICMGIFNTLVVLSGVPRSGTESHATLPTALRWFVQFVLIPLVLLFLVILYAYGIRVVFFSDLRGAVAGYILALNVFALLALVLAWPLRNDPGHRVVSVFTKAIGPILVPMTLLLILAIGIRIADYGVTPPRFGVALLTAFVIVVNLYLLRRRDIDVRAIPLTLAVLGMITALGPLGSAQSTVRSQTRRMHQALRDAGAVRESGVDTARFQRANDTVRSALFGAFETIRSVDTAAASAVLVHLGIPSTVDSVTKRRVITTMGEPITSLNVDQDRTYFYLSSPNNEPRTLMLPHGRASAFTVRQESRSTQQSGDWKISYNESLRIVALLHRDGSATDTIRLAPLFTSTKAANDAPKTPFMLTATSGKRMVLVQGGYLQFARGEAPQFTLDGLLLDLEGRDGVLLDTKRPAKD